MSESLRVPLALSALLVLAPLAPAQAKGSKSASGDGGAADSSLGPAPKGVDEAIKANVDRGKKEAEILSSSLGGDFNVVQGPTVAIRAEESIERLSELVRIAETIVETLSTDLEVDKMKDLWAGKRGPFNVYYFKSKSSFGDALREYLEKRYPSHSLAQQRPILLDIGRFIYETPSPLSGGHIEGDFEFDLAHKLGQTILLYTARLGPRFPGLPKDKERDKNDEDTMEGEHLSWLTEGFAMYSSVRFFSANRNYCVTNAKYVGNIAIADKDVDTAYRLVCLEMAQGDEKSKDFATLTRTENNSLDYLDLAKAWSFFDWMMEAENRPTLVKVIKGMRGPNSFAKSLKVNGGMSLSDLEQKWRDWVIDAYGRKKKAPSSAKPPGKSAK